MSKAVFDSSALLAVINDEVGAERVLELLSMFDTSLISVVNLSEAHAVMIRRGLPEDTAWRIFSSFKIEPIAFDASLGRSAGALIGKTQDFGLSLGDRACIALGLQEQCPVITGDRAWSKLKTGIEVVLFR